MEKFFYVLLIAQLIINLSPPETFLVLNWLFSVLNSLLDLLQVEFVFFLFQNL